MIALDLQPIWNDIMAFGIQIIMLILKLVRAILNLIFDIANINFIEDEVIGKILTRVYIIVGILMLFKIVISCVQYLINPDKSEDKEGGFGAIIKRALISIALLALIPSIFNFAKSAQGAIIDALPKVILGQENTKKIDDIGNDLTFYTALSFFDYANDNCNDGSIAGRGKEQGSPIFSNIDDISSNASVIIESTCSASNNQSRYKFNWLVALATPVYLTILLTTMAFDVAIRTIKFSFLQMIAPVPIASYIDPKTSKKSFDSWLHNCLTVYADLFIRLGVIYLVLHLFLILFPSFVSDYTLIDGTKLTPGRSDFINIVMIIALFIFAKDGPKFICEVLGIKSDGSIGDMFKLKNLRHAAGFAGAGLGMATAGLSNLAYGLANKKWGRKVVGGVGSALKGIVQAGLHGGRAAFSGKGFNAGFSGHQYAVNARQSRQLERAQGATFGKRMQARFLDFVGFDDSSSLAEGRVKAFEQVNSATAKLKGHWNDLLVKYGGQIDVMQNSSFKASLSSLLNSQATNIATSGHPLAQDLLTKVNSRGGIITYQEVMALKKASENTAGLEVISAALDSQSETMKSMQSALWNDGMVNGGVKDSSGSAIAALKYGDSDFDTTLAGDIAEMEGILYQNSADLGVVEVGGTKYSGNSGPKRLFQGFVSNFKAFDDQVLIAKTKVRQKTSTKGSLAAARAANQKRDSNKKNNS